MTPASKNRNGFETRVSCDGVSWPISYLFSHRGLANLLGFIHCTKIKSKTRESKCTVTDLRLHETSDCLLMLKVQSKLLC